ncbi:hypothetical protein E1A91_A13G182400v1 [Gossypium mustelinum]|uniref:Uncharacterized protein n=1 Tax=Gossypium mustelinum TaxID=34275 RepID=A0A5D2WJK9_GOSMU|nr:hypothetical protein E1A91_A13G182400v1 [Gossypium mustelinum]
MALLQPTSLVFTVERQEPELIVPAKPTPHECKLLSDTDDQAGHRFQIRGLHIYRNNAFACRERTPLKEGPNRKLMVDCSGEGVLFIEGDADVTLEDFGDSLHPPFPCFKELLYELPASIDLLNSPLLQIQVTRFKCGGFIFAHRFNHNMSDAVGLIQFMSTMGEMARGAVAPSIPPVWERHLLNARDPPLITCAHLEYDHDKATTALKRSIPDNLRCSTFDILTACIWRCRTKALELGPDEDVRFICIVNSRSKFNPPLPLGYYGNALGYPAVETTAAKLCQNPLEYAIKLVKEAKGKVTEEYMKSTADLMVIRGRPNVNTVRSLILSDLSRARFREVDFGWGKAEFGGPASGEEVISFYIPSKNKEGKEGITVPVCLPAPLMDSFVKEINRKLKDDEATGG